MKRKIWFSPAPGVGLPGVSLRTSWRGVKVLIRDIGGKNWSGWVSNGGVYPR